jgi:hypothetical protein
MTKYMVLWRIKMDELSIEPEGMEKAMDMLFSAVTKFFEEGTLLDWGLFLDGQYGYAIREMEPSDLQKWFITINQFVEVVDVQEVINFDEAQKNIDAVTETMMR